MLGLLAPKFACPLQRLPACLANRVQCQDCFALGPSIVGIARACRRSTPGGTLRLPYPTVACHPLCPPFRFANSMQAPGSSVLAPSLGGIARAYERSTPGDGRLPPER